MQKRFLSILIFLLLSIGGCIHLFLKLSKLNARHTELTLHAEQTERELRIQQLLTKAGRDFLEGRVDQAMEGYALADSLQEENSGWSLLLTDQLFVRDSLRSNLSRLSRDNRISSNRLKLFSDTLQATRMQMTLAHNALDSTSRQLLHTKGKLAQARTLEQQCRQENEAIRQSFGKLTFLNTKGKEVVYFGDIANGMANGEGIGIFNLRSVYYGQWKDNLRHGHGTYRWENGDTYVGDFLHGKRHGHGIYTFTSGDRYEGEWEDDLRHGKGKFVSDANDFKYEGTWKADKYQRNASEEAEVTE